MSQRIIQVDSFTDRPFGGNPAAVCLLSGPADEEWMQRVATEMNLSETAFLYPEGDDYQLRWFTPAVEVDLCGHATLASAHVLWEDGHLTPDREARFHTRSGLLTANKRAELIELTFPAQLTESCDMPQELIAAMGVRPATVAHIPPADYLIELESEQELHSCRPDFNRLLAADIRGVIVTTHPEAGEYDFISRFFAPGAGINEDPVTGYAHCVLGPYWAPQLKKDKMLAYQASARGGVVHVRVDGDRVILGGQAVTVLRCELLV